MSLPGPGRGSDLVAYGADLRARCDETGAELIAVVPEMVELVASLALGHPVVAFDDLLGGDQGPDSAGGVLIQFTSGSTARPKGIPLSTLQLGANVAAINERCANDRNAHCAAWLPLSHDMGLIGMTLSIWAAGAVVEHIRPETFMAKPVTWLEGWSRIGSYVTAAPNFALEVVAKAVTRKPPVGLDLSKMQMMICGGEVVRPETLRRFTEALRPYGFRDHGIAPAYGMAEAGLAVTIGKPGELWGSLHVDPGALADGRLVQIDAGGIELAGNGTPLEGYTVGGPILDCEGVALGELSVEGPSLYPGYLGATPRGGAHRTGDLGAVVGSGPLQGQVLVAGRIDDLLAVRGRNLYALELEAALTAIDDLRPGCQVCVADSDGGYVVVTETRPGANRSDVAREVRAALAKSSGVAPSGVAFIAAGALPKTSSGKKQRSAVAVAVRAGTLDIEDLVTFRGRV